MSCSVAQSINQEVMYMGGILSVIILIFDIVAIVDVLKSSMDGTKKALWVLLIIFLPVIGVVLYFLLGKNKG